MKVPLSWLRELVEVSVPVPELARRLTMAGLEVEDVHVVGSDWRDVSIARVAELEPHPRADSLFVARLELGGASRTVVTAATNLRVGDVVPHVAPGGQLPSGEVGSRAFGGITSEGMVCSGDELDISPDRDGIYVFESDAPIGTPVAEYLNETVLDIYIGPNRPDCMSMVGLAREIHALFDAAYTPAFLRLLDPATAVVAGSAGAPPTSDVLSIRIEDAEGCPRFTASVLRGITIGTSPHWLQRRLHFAGVRPISNVVDVTNYVMLEVGQPLHAFDRQRLGSDTIVVRRAHAGERLRTLDGEERALGASMMVVADTERARSLAGIMGGEDSEIADTTDDVVLEGANWDRASIRLTSSALSLATEASRRFGRGVDPDLTALAVARSTDLTLQLAGGVALAGLVDVYPGRSAPRTISVRPAQIEALMGTSYPRQQVVHTLSALGFRVEPGVSDASREAADADELRVTVPGWRRFDVEGRADLAEEVGRIEGFDRIPATMLGGELPELRPDGDGGFADELHARRALAAAGLNEVITYALVDPGQAALLAADADPAGTAGTSGAAAERDLVVTAGTSGAGDDRDPTVRAATSGPALDGETPISIANPQSTEASVLRTSLLGSLLAPLRTNLRQRERVLLFELARTWRGELQPLPDERRHVGIVMTGPRTEPHWSGAPAALDFYDLKGVVTSLCDTFNVHPTYIPARHPSLHPGRTADILTGGLRFGVMGELHPTVAERFDLQGHTILAAELDFELLLRAGHELSSVVTPSRFPPSDRDVAIVVDAATPHAEVEAAIREAAQPLLESVRLFDIYTGAPIEPGRKSLAYSLRYRASDRTLEDDEVTTAHARVEEALRTRFRGEVRGR